MAVLIEAAKLVDRSGPPVLRPFCEMGFGGQWRESLRMGIECLAEFNREISEGQKRQPVGFKLRAGGVEASAFPPVEQVAWVVAACRDHKVPLKATAGLHHPFRRYDAGVQAFMNGFVNLFSAGVLARARDLGESDVQAILLDERPDHFEFDADGLRWGKWQASVEEIEAARRNGVLSFGSCSFDEPRDDLRQLGLL